MTTFLKWIKQTVNTLVDPDKEERTQNLVWRIESTLQARREQFTLAAALEGMPSPAPGDLEAAKEIVYRRVLERGWSDGKLSAGQQKTARLVARLLEIPAQKATAVNLELARRHFAIALAKAMEDGVLEDHEVAQLEEIASSVGASMAQFSRQFFRSEGEGFLRGVFLACVADGHLSQQEWNCLLTTTQRLGLSRDEMLHAVQAQARQFVERVLADAKEDGRLSPEEDTTLKWLVDNLGLPHAYRRYVESEVDLLRLLTEIDDGRLPSLKPPAGIAVRSGEIVHLHSNAIWRHVRVLKSGPRSDDHSGTLTLTDDRLIFSSPTKSQTIRYRRIVSHRGLADRIEVQVEGKPLYSFFFPERSPVPAAVFHAAVAMANQTKVARVEGKPSRHIPRDVRQRVWQRYGGRCADCGADDYLEFDHVIPVAKGGSNTDNNVQLLCRRCNLKKSDRI